MEKSEPILNKFVLSPPQKQMKSDKGELLSQENKHADTDTIKRKQYKKPLLKDAVINNNCYSQSQTKIKGKLFCGTSDSQQKCFAESKIRFSKNSLPKLKEVDNIIQTSNKKNNTKQNISSPNRIFLIGAHSTGKTTICLELSKKFPSQKVIDEIARNVFKEMELSAQNFDIVQPKAQIEIFNRKYHEENPHILERDESIISDRCSLDGIVQLHWAKFSSDEHRKAALAVADQIEADDRFKQLLAMYRESNTKFYFITPSRLCLEDDGERFVDELEELQRYNLMQMDFMKTRWKIDCHQKNPEEDNAVEKENNVRIHELVTEDINERIEFIVNKEKL